MHRGHSRRIVPLVVAAAALGLSALGAVPAEAALPGNPGPILAGVVISVDQQGIVTENADGTNETYFGTPAALGQGQAPAWAPDGSRIVYESGEGGIESSLPDGTGAYPINEGVDWTPTFTQDGANVIGSTPSTGLTRQLEYSSSTWSVLDHQGQGDMKPWFAKSTGGTDEYPSVSSTGAVFFEHDTDTTNDIWTDHGTRTPGLVITGGGQPDISPDAARLAFVRSVSGFDQIFVQAADGSGTATQLTSGSANHDYPKWSPDGSTLYYNYNPGTDYAQIVGHELDLVTSTDTPTPNGLSYVTQQPLPKPGPASTFHAVTPVRLLDTRNAIGVGTRTPVAAGGTLRLKLPAGKPVPAGATAVVLNVTVTGAKAAGYLTAYPDGTPRPTASNLNWTKGETIPNQVIVPVGTGGTVDLYNHSSGTTHVIADVAGYYTADTTGATFTAAGPARLLDTRGKVGVSTTTPVAAGGTVHLKVAGASVVPATGVTSVVLNVTVTAPKAAGYLTAYPDGASRPTASNLNWTEGETIANHVVVPVGADGRVDFYNGSGGTTQVIADVAGYYSASATGAVLHAVPPTRLLDTRSGSAVGADGTAVLGLSGTVVPTGATAVILNVTVTDTKAAGYLTAYPHGTSRPTASNLNWTKGETIPNLVTVPVIDGKIALYNHGGGSTDVIADVFGYFTA